MTAEFDLIRLIAAKAGSTREDILVGIGDDAAVMAPPPGRELVATMDTLNAGVHFFSDVDPERLGHKALAVNLSDLAAMGAEPRWALLSITLPSGDEAWLQRFMAGFLSLARRHGVCLVGGDTCQGPLSVTVTALGLGYPGRSLLRSGARPGDLVVVSGELGAAGYALSLLRGGQPVPADLREALERPVPRLELGAALAGEATACIDLSDGLLADLGHLAAASGCGADLDLATLPCVSGMESLEPETRWTLQLCAGDDYELCFTWPADRVGELDDLAQATGQGLSKVGRLTGDSGIRCVGPGGEIFHPPRAGHEHFR